MRSRSETDIPADHGAPHGAAAVLRFIAWAAPGLSLGAFVAAWQLASLAYPPFILPGPALVALRFVDRVQDGSWAFHTAATAAEAVLGLLAGGTVALAAGYAIARSRIAERLLSPFIVASQGVPFVAVAPLIFIWFGNGLGAKILLCALVVFFPILINIAAGLRSVPQAWRDLFRIHHAGRWHTFSKLEWPAALPHIASGARVGGTLAVIGAIAAEFVSANRGLGFLIAQAGNLYDTPSVMVGVLTVVGLALCLYGAVGLAARAARWRPAWSHGAPY